jgi:hypothetical protein
MHVYRIYQSLSITTSALLLSACAGLLPKSSNDASPFASFEEARLAIEGLTPMQSNIAALKAIGIDPSRHPNTTIMTHADVVRRFVPASVLQKQDLDPGIVACLEARDACRGLDVVASRVSRNRTGNFFTDFFNFRRQTDTSGWRFNAVVLLKNDLVVYRNWGGQPVLNETEIRTNPLGPLQDVGPSTISVSPSVVVK